MTAATADQGERVRIQMMGFLDGELPPEERREFLERCWEDPELAAELAAYKKINDIADSMRLREPEDFEYERLVGRLGSQLERRLGAMLLAFGSALVVVWSLWLLFSSPFDAVFKIGAACALIGLLLYGGSELRIRRRVRRLDRYQGVRR